MPANYSSKGDVKSGTITATYAEDNHVTGAGFKTTCSLGDPAPPLGKTACFDLETYIWMAISKEDTVSGELHFIPVIKLKVEEWVRTAQYDTDGTPTFSWTQIKRVWIMMLTEQNFMSNVKGNLITEHHNVSVQETGWAPVSSIRTRFLHPYSTVLNFSLHEGGNVVTLNDVYAATLGYTMPVREEKIYSYFPTYPGCALSKLDDIRSSTPGTVRLGPLGTQEYPNDHVKL